LADPLNKYFSQEDPEVYNAEVIRGVVQQSGRICRTPTDIGTTYILDASFQSLYWRCRKSGLFPDYFLEALEWK
jgi:Rad3-related DNA helicase